MTQRLDVLKPFQEQADYMNDRIRHGIENNRKGYYTLQFQKGDRTPVERVHVKIKQTQHDFKVGANLFMIDEFDREEQNEAYKRLFADAFNIATLPFYWRDLEPEQGKPRFSKDSPKVYRRPAPDLCLEYCQEHGIEPKAHCLNYASFSPGWARGPIAWEKKCLEKRFRELAERYARQIPMWEVTNETFWGCDKRDSHFYQQPDFIEWSFKLAEEYFPANKLVINEAHSRIWDNAHFYRDRSPYYMQIERALLKGARIDAIGMQYHMFYRAENEIKETGVFYSPQRIFGVLDTYAQLGKPIHITELTIPAYAWSAADEDIQAEIIKNIYSMWFSHPAVDGIIYWNLVDGFAHGTVQGDMTSGENYYHGGLVRYDFTPKPAYHLIRELFGKTWRTNLEADGGSAITFKGFHGTYDLEVTVDGQTYQRSIHLTPEQGATRTVWL